MGRIKEHFHDQLEAEREEHAAAMEQMWMQQQIDEVAEACAHDEELYALFLKRMEHYKNARSATNT